jgi:haloacetate dehalogenase
MSAAGARHSVAVEGVRFSLERSDPSRKRRTTPTLLLHGVPETSLCWRELTPRLGTDRVVLAPDLKGLGASETREPYDMATLVAELAALVLHEVDGAVDVVGHDWGGSIGLALASARPELVRRLVVIAAPYRHVDLRASWHIPVFALPALPELAFRLAGEEIVRRMFGHAWRAETPLPADILEAYVAAYADADRVSAMLAYYRAAARPRIARAVGLAPKQDGAPRAKPERSLVIWGTDDPAMPMWVGESVVRDLGADATLLAVPDVGHWPVEEAPDVVLPAIVDFLRAL